MKACCTLYNGRDTACKSAPSAILALAVGCCMAPDLWGSGYMGPQHVSGTWAAVPSRLQASVRGFDVMHELALLYFLAWLSLNHGSPGSNKLGKDMQ